MRLSVRVTPGSRRPGVRVGIGTGGQGPRPAPARAGLLVAVSEPAVDGRATAAALRAVAVALGVRPGAVRLVSGATSRTKLIEVDGDPAALMTRIGDLPR